MNTAFLLMAQYDGKAIIPVASVCADYFPHLRPDQFLRKIGSGEIKLPLVRAETSQKSAKGVHLQDLAQYIDERATMVMKDFGLKAGSFLPAPVMSANHFVTREFVLGLKRISPNVSGIYFLFCGDECVYVGQSTRLHTRIREHMEGASQKEFESYAWFECLEEDLNTLEVHCIAMLEPRFNNRFPQRSG